MQRLATLTVMAALISPTVVSGQDYSFGDWARDQGYEPGDVMPWQVGRNGSWNRQPRWCQRIRLDYHTDDDVVAVG